MNNLECAHFHCAESFHTYLMLKSKISFQSSKAAFSNIANGAFIAELHVFLTPQDNTFSFPSESIFLLYPTTRNVCISLFCLPAWIIIKRSQLASIPFSFLPKNCLWQVTVTSKHYSYSHSLAPSFLIKLSPSQFSPHY